MDDPRKLISQAENMMIDLIEVGPKERNKQAAQIQYLSKELTEAMCSVLGHKLVCGLRKKKKIKLLCHFCQADLTYA